MTAREDAPTMDRNTDWRYDAVVQSVHDGDTIILDVDLGFGVWFRNMKIRLYGLDAPELATPAGKESLAFVQSLVKAGDRVVLESIKDRTDKYGGRWLGILWLSGAGLGDQSLNYTLIHSGHAFPWDGKGDKPGSPANSI